MKGQLCVGPPHAFAPKNGGNTRSKRLKSVTELNLIFNLI